MKKFKIDDLIGMDVWQAAVDSRGDICIVFQDEENDCYYDVTFSKIIHVETIQEGQIEAPEKRRFLSKFRL